MPKFVDANLRRLHTLMYCSTPIPHRFSNSVLFREPIDYLIGNEQVLDIIQARIRSSDMLHRSPVDVAFISP